MKSFELGEYMKPMISKPGIIASRRNKFFLNSFLKSRLNSDNSETLHDIPISKFPKLESSRLKSKKKTKGSYSFKAVGRCENFRHESPPPGRYSPNYDFLLKKSPVITFGKQTHKALMEKSQRISITPEVGVNQSSEGTQRIRGIPFEKQLKRKTIYSSENPHEKRFESPKNNQLLHANRVHSFASYTPRRPFYNISEYLPDYSPNYDFVSKPYKT